jgi:hypothetical protein
MSSTDASPALTAMAAITMVARWNAASAPTSAGPAGWPSTVTRIATPRTMPTWRAIVTTPDPVAKRCGGTADTAALTSVGSARPTPVPVISMPGSMWAA